MTVLNFLIVSVRILRLSRYQSFLTATQIQFFQRYFFLFIVYFYLRIHPVACKHYFFLCNQKVTLDCKAIELLLGYSKSSIEDILAEGPKAICKLGKSLTSLLRFDYTTEGARVFINGQSGS